MSGAMRRSSERRSQSSLCWGFLSRTPSPPPFSSMNSTPAASNAHFKTTSVVCRVSAPPASNCLTVATPIRAASANFCWVQSRSPRAARHCEAVIMTSWAGTINIRVNTIVFRLTDMRLFLYYTSENKLKLSMGIIVGKEHSANRRNFIGGSDARIIMGDDDGALVRLWKEKRGEVGPEDLSRNLIVQLGSVTEDLNRHWYQANTGQVITDIQKHVRHPGLRSIAATLDGRVNRAARFSRPSLCCPGTSRKK